MIRQRIILMYISEISGHHSATLAIEKAIRQINPDAEIMNINAFNYTNPISEKIINRIYLGVITKTPKLWDFLYDNPSVVKKLTKIKEIIHKVNSPKLKTLFDGFKPDIVACSQAFPCGMVADFKKEFRSTLPLVAVLTDYVPHSYWIYDTINYYISPSDDVSARLRQKGVPADKIRVLGIPFDHKFNAPLDKDQIVKNLGLKKGISTILIMGGGQGLGPITVIIDSLQKINQEIQIIVVTGTNKKLFSLLSKKAQALPKKTLVYGYAANINELMGIADLIISKPGGITTAEALALGLPMIIVKPIPGQEENNTSFLTQKGAAIKLDDPQETCAVIEALLHDKEKYNAMRSAAGLIAKPQASIDIAKLLLGI